MERYELTYKQIEQAMADAHRAWSEQLARKGAGIFVSRHEAFGVLYEEFDELTDELRPKTVDAFRSELLDVLVVALHALASLDSKKWREFRVTPDGGGRKA